MGLDPNIVLQMIMGDMQRKASERRDDAEAARRRGEQEFELGLQTALNPDLDTNAFLATFQNLSPARADLLRSIDKTTKKKTRAAEAVSSPTGGVPSQPDLGRDELLQALRAAEPVRNAMSQQAQQQAISTRRQSIADATRDELINNAAGLIALNPSDPELRASALQLVQEQFPEAGEEVARAVLGRAAFQGQTGVGSTQSERWISLLPLGKRSGAREALLAQRISPTQTVRQRTPIATAKALELGEQDDRATAGLALGQRMIDTIRSDPAAVGFGSYVRGAIQSVSSVAGGVDSVLGTGTFEQFQQLALDRLADLPPDAQRSEEATAIFEMLTDPSAAEVDFGQLMLSFLLESSVTGNRRFSIQAVERIHESVQGGMTRPPAVTVKILEQAVRKLERDTLAGRERLRRLDPEIYQSLLPGFTPIQPLKSTEPPFTFDPERGLVPVPAGP